MRRIFVLTSLACLLCVAGFANAAAPRHAAAQSDDEPVTLTTVRFVNAVPDTDPLAVAIDGDAVADGIAFGASSDYVTVVPGERTIEARAAGQSLATGQPDIDEGSAYIVTFLGQIGDVGVKVNEVKLSALDPGKARVRLIHASPDAGEVDLQVAGGETLFDGVKFEVDTEYKEIDAGAYQFDLLGDDGSALASVPLDVQPGRVFDLIALGVVGQQTFTLLPMVTDVSPPCSEVLGVGTPNDACVRVVNGHQFFGDIDVAIAGNLIAQALPFGAATEFAAIRAEEDLAITTVPTGMADASEEPNSVSLTAGQAYVAVTWSNADDGAATADALEQTRIELYKVDVTPLAEEQARLRVIHASPDAGKVDVVVPSLADPELAEEVGEGDATEYEILDAGSYPAEVHFAGEEAAFFETELTLETGVVYDVLALGSTEAESFMLLVLTAPAEVRSSTASPAASVPGATPEPMSQGTPVS